MSRDNHKTSSNIQSNLNSSNTDSSFTMANSNLLSSPYEILPIARQNKFLESFLFIIKLYVVCTRKIRLIDAILINTQSYNY